MFIVRRTFRGPKGPLSAGSVIEPADIKDFRYRLQQRHVVEVTEHNFKRYQSFFTERYGVDIPALTSTKADAKAKAEAEAKAAKAEAEAKAAEEAKPTAKVAKAVTKTN